MKKRAAWAKEQFSHVSASKQHVVTWREVDTKLGEYHTLGSLVRSYGGWQWRPAIVAAERHAHKCAAMGGKWVRLDSDFSGLHHFLKLSITHQYISDNAWQQYLTYDNNGQKKQLSVQDLDPSAPSSSSVQDQRKNPTSASSSRAKAKNKSEVAATSNSKAGANMNEEQEEHNQDGKKSAAGAHHGKQS